VTTVENDLGTSPLPGRKDKSIAARRLCLVAVRSDRRDGLPCLSVPLPAALTLTNCV